MKRRGFLATVLVAPLAVVGTKLAAPAAVTMVPVKDLMAEGTMKMDSFSINSVPLDDPEGRGLEWLAERMEEAWGG